MGAVRDKLLDAAEELFGHAGFRAAGIDAIIARAGVAKMTLYKHFPSKDALIVAVLERLDARRRAEVMDGLDRLEPSPVSRLLALFDILAASAAQGRYRSGLFIAALVEFPAADHPGRVRAGAHARWLEELCHAMAQQAGVTDPVVLASQWVSLLQGTSLQAATTGQSAAFDTSKRLARIILDQ